ncbi:MAG TPA: SDR family NAD(P)-dependent oxidoreductase [Burkholderiales bacterium]|nr:SDR family NAD(P)-dependent oxidoreductase [Burkholderiales bacterium]
MDTGLKGKTALITGASRNIGRVAALAFAREGANLVLCTSSKMDALREVEQEVRAIGSKVVAAQCDVSDAAAVAELVRLARQAFGAVDIAVNNAVYRAEGGSFLDQSFEKWQRNIEVNLNGPYHVCRAVLPGMMRQRWGRIINFSGIAPFLGHGVAKATVKTGIIGFTRGLASEFAAHNITANCIGPGTIAVERDAFQNSKGLRPAQPVRRLGKPEEIAALCIFLASEHAAYITGQCYLANGGMYFL